jgi:hypothetical protein
MCHHTDKYADINGCGTCAHERMNATRTDEEPNVSDSAQRHLTLQGHLSGYPVCGAPLSTKLPGSLHAAYWRAEEHGRDFCPACMAIVAEIDAEA